MLLLNVHTFGVMREFILGKKLQKNVARLSDHDLASGFTTDFILEKVLTIIVSVVSCLSRFHNVLALENSY